MDKIRIRTVLVLHKKLIGNSMKFRKDITEVENRRLLKSRRNGITREFYLKIEKRSGSR